MSGSFVVAGSGLFCATHVGTDSFASGLTAQAKKFHLTNSELRDAINGFIRGISFLLVPVGLLLLWSQLVRADLPVEGGHPRHDRRRHHDGARGARPADQHRDGGLGHPAGAEEGPGAGHARRRGARPGRHDLRRQDRHPDRAGHERARGRPARPGADGVDLDAVLGAMGASESSPNPTLVAIARPVRRPRLDRHRERALLQRPQVVGGQLRRPRHVAARRPRDPVDRRPGRPGAGRRAGRGRRPRAAAGPRRRLPVGRRRARAGRSRSRSSSSASSCARTPPRPSRTSSSRTSPSRSSPATTPRPSAPSRGRPACPGRTSPVDARDAADRPRRRSPTPWPRRTCSAA